MAKEKELDITKTGPIGYRQLQQANSLDANQMSPEDYKFLTEGRRGMNSFSLYNPYTQAEQLVESGLNNTATPWGESMFDDANANEEEFQHLGDVRAKNQPWISKLAAGVGKGAALAGTTFLDGTVGLLAGIPEMPEKGYSAIWDNSFSNAMQAINQELENLLPNYRTEEELNNKWYENLGTINFWADSFIKNLGFTVGAFYSGNALTKALKAMNLVKGAMGAKIAGSTLSAINEGRIEANNNSDDWEKLEVAKLDDAYYKRGQEIMNSDMSEVEKSMMLDTLDSAREDNLEDIKTRKARMGLIDLIGNTVLLSLDNYMTFGKLYARGFKNSKTLAQNAKKEAMDEAGKQVSGDLGHYVWNDITKKQAVRKGLMTGLREGNEEMSQAFLADAAGLYQSYDSPDAYYEAMVNPEAEKETNNFLTSVTEGFANTYGNVDKYEEFAVGALTGILGMPTFGRVNNSDSNTYLGKGKMIGLSGGLFGEISNAKQQNEDGREAVDYANKYMQKFQNQKRHFVQSQSFTKAMDGWAEEGDAFEFKNAEDNDDFSAISRFADIGKLDDFKEMINQDFDNISDEELEEIATSTSQEGTEGGWKNTDGTLMSSTEEGRAKMREDLNAKKKKILDMVDSYEKSVESVKAIGNNSLSKEQVDELAWLQWKVGRFSDRFDEVKKDNEKEFNTLLRGLQQWEDTLKDARFYMTEDDKENWEENTKWLKEVEAIKKVIETIKNTDNIFGIANYFKENPKMLEALQNRDTYELFADQSTMDYNKYKQAINNLIDVSRLANAADTFNQRLKEFTEDPIKIIQNREKIDKKKEGEKAVTSKLDMEEKLREKPVSEIVEGMDNGLDFSGMDDMPDDISAKIDEANEIKKKSLGVTKAIDSLPDDKVPEQAKKDAKTLLEKSKKVSQSSDELLDLDTEAFNDIANLMESEDEEVKAAFAGREEEYKAFVQERLDMAKSVIAMAKQAEETSQAEIAALSESKDTKHLRTVGEEYTEKETGHDATSKIKSTQEQTEEKKKQSEESAKSISNKTTSILENAGIPAEPSLYNDLNSVLHLVKDCVEAGVEPKVIVQKLNGSSAYNRAKKVIPNLQEQISNYYQELKGTKPAETSTKPKEEKEVEYVPYIPTSVQINRESNNEYERNFNYESSSDIYNFWKPNTTLLPIHGTKGNTTPFYKIARTLKKEGRPLYTEAQLKRMEAVGEYLEEHNAFSNVDNGLVKAGDEVHFFIDKALNEKAGELVILMTDSQGRIIGDVTSESSTLITKQLGLNKFVERVKKEYEEAGSPESFTSKEVTTVNKNMIGKVPYLADSEGMNSLNSIFTVNDSKGGTKEVDFELAISVATGKNPKLLIEPGRTKKQGQSTREQATMSPLIGHAGQPFVLLNTSRTRTIKGKEEVVRVPVPFIMKPISDATRNTALGRALEAQISKLSSIKEGEEMPIVDAIKELLVLPDTTVGENTTRGIYIKVNNGNVTVTIKPIRGEKTTIYSGKQDDPNMVNTIMNGLYGTPFNISRKYINDTYNGQNYNRMIGEIAETNLPIGGIHTISDWFTINPLDDKGEPIKGKSPKSTRVNPNRASRDIVSLTIKDQTFEVNLQNNEVRRTNDDLILTEEQFGVEKVNAIRAYAQGINNKNNMEKPYLSSWGWFNPKTMKFELPEVSQLSKMTVPESSEGTTIKTFGGELVAGQEEKEDKANKDKSNEDKESIPESKEENNTPQQSSSLQDNKATIKPVKGLASASMTEEELTKLANEEKLIAGSAKKKEAWNALSNAQKAALLNTAGPSKIQKMRRLEMAYTPSSKSFDIKRLGKPSVDALLGIAKFRKASAERRTTWNQKREERWMHRVLPQLSTSDRLRIQEGLIKTSMDKTGKAWGMFKDGVITIANNAARGTLYHEAFHSVVDTLMSEQEVSNMYKAAREKFGNLSDLALEEELAEEFRRYVQIEETPIIGSAIKAFRTLKHIIKNLVGKEPYLDNLYYRINRGKFSNRSIPNTNTQEIEQYHIDKLKYDNLNEEDKQYIEDRKITTEEYNQMSQLEKEVLFRCR